MNQRLDLDTYLQNTKSQRETAIFGSCGHFSPGLIWNRPLEAARVDFASPDNSVADYVTVSEMGREGREYQGSKVSKQFAGGKLVNQG